MKNYLTSIDLIILIDIIGIMATVVNVNKQIKILINLCINRKLKGISSKSKINYFNNYIPISKNTWNIHSDIDWQTDRPSPLTIVFLLQWCTYLIEFKFNRFITMTNSTRLNVQQRGTHLSTFLNFKTNKTKMGKLN